MSYKVIKHIFAVEQSWGSIQLNYMKWHDNPPKYDLRKWSEDGEPQKGFTLSMDELEELSDKLDYFLSKDNDETDGSNLEIDEEIPDEVEIDFKKFIVHSDMDYCDEEEHDYEEIVAHIFVYNKGIVTPYKCTAYYCNDCNAYYIMESTYEELKRHGRIMCQVFSQDAFFDYMDGDGFGELNPESLLHRIGYNVGQAENLSSEERHTILEYGIESGLLTKKKIDDHLSFLINTNEGRRNYSKAIEKWKEDRKWALNYKTSGKRLVGIKYIVDDAD